MFTQFPPNLTLGAKLNDEISVQDILIMDIIMECDNFQVSDLGNDHSIHVSTSRRSFMKV